MGDHGRHDSRTSAGDRTLVLARDILLTMSGQGRAASLSFVMSLGDAGWHSGRRLGRTIDGASS